MNDGKCASLTEDEGSFKCECPSGFKGKRCEIVPVIANSTISAGSTIRPILSTSTKLPSQETTTRNSEESAEDEVEEEKENEKEHSAADQTTAENSSESDVVEEPSLEEIDNEA